MNEASKYIDQWVRADGYTNGRTDGYTDGIAHGVATSLLAVLKVRCLDVPPNVRERISSCTDLDVLQKWFTLALNATNVDAFVKAMD
jgi:hypothetical protein